MISISGCQGLNNMQPPTWLITDRYYYLLCMWRPVIISLQCSCYYYSGHIYYHYYYYYYHKAHRGYKASVLYLKLTVVVVKHRFGLFINGIRDSESFIAAVPKVWRELNKLRELRSEEREWKRLKLELLSSLCLFSSSSLSVSPPFNNPFYIRPPSFIPRERDCESHGQASLIGFSLYPKNT